MNRKIVQVIAAAAVLAAGGQILTVYGVNGDLEEAKSQISALEEEKEKVEARLGELQSLRDNTAAYVKELDASLNQLAEELSGLEEQISQKEQEIEEKGQELEAARETEQEQYESMKLRIKYMYERGETSYLDLLMDSSSVSQMLGRAEYISKITEYDRNMLIEYKETREAVARQEEALKEDHESLLAMEDSVKAKQSSVQELMDSKEAELAGYESDIASAQDQLDEYQADIQAQEDQMRRIEEEMRRQEEEARQKAQAAGQTYTVKDLGNISFIWPCPSSSRITSYFGGRESPTAGASTNHKGIDIGASQGSSILAAAEGRVVISTYSYSAGNYIMIDHGGGVSTVYMHCSQLLVSQGEQVSQGQVIAKVGSTGYSTGPHLHFGIRSGGSYVNPLNYVSP